MKKAISIFIITILLMCICYSTTYAADLKPIENLKPGSEIDGKLDTIRGNAIAIMQVIGVSVAVVMLVFVAIKYMTSAPNDRAEVKKHMIPYVIGAVFIFGSVGIVQLIKAFAQNAL